MVAYAVDIEPTNRCNADCHFCPRDMSPHEGLMSLEVFEQSLARVIEYRDTAIAISGSCDFDWVSLCGEGEPLLNRNLPTFIRRIREVGLRTHVASNGSLLDDRRRGALLDAGLQRIALNVGEIGEDYERVYKLPWKKTRDNVLRFIEEAGDQCEVWIVLVDHRDDPAHIRKMTKFWRERGVDQFLRYTLTNRGGSLFVDHMQYEDYPERVRAQAILDELPNPPRCAVPFYSLFIGYDGQYYLCCSDWQKQVPFGSVFDRSFVDIVRDKIEAVTYRDRVCKTCDNDPLNLLTAKIREVEAGTAQPEDIDTLVGEMRWRWALPRKALESYDESLVGWTPAPRDPEVGVKRLIPVRAD